MFRYRIVSVVVAGIACTLVSWSAPARSQEDPSVMETTLEETIPGDPNVEKAITTKNLSIPVDELALMVKPLTLEELEIEAAAWLLILQQKVKEISDGEIAIKRQNAALAKQQEAIAALTSAQQSLAEAEEAQKTAAPGTPEYEAATKKIEEAKQSLKDAQAAVEESSEMQRSLEEDEALNAALAKAGETANLEKAKELLETTKADRDTFYYPGTFEFNEQTLKIDTLDTAIREVEKAKEALQAAEPNTPEAEEATQNFDAAQAALLKAIEAIEGPSAPTNQSQNSQQTEQLAATLENTQIDSAGQSFVAGPTGMEGDANLQRQQQQIDNTSNQLEENSEAQSEQKNQLVVTVTELQNERTAIIDRFKAVLAELDKKGGDSTSYIKYIDAISGVEIDVKDTEGLALRLVSWAQSDEGGMRWLTNAGTFVGIVVATTLAAQALGWIVERTLSMSGKVSTILIKFLSMTIKRGGLVAGVLLALMALEVALGPLLALLGGASFVLAFALQSNLGNFASGLMLMVYKPFDVGDEIQIGDVWGFVDSITLGGTKINSFSNQLITIPNNTVWSSTITNNTGHDVRGVTVSFQIGYDSPLPRVEEILMDLFKQHPLILDDPKPYMFPSEFRQSAINVEATAFTKTENRWTVFADMFAQFQERLAKENIDMVDYQEVNLHYIPNGNGSLPIQLAKTPEMGRGMTPISPPKATPTAAQGV